jgi:hypothetical protein
LTTVHTPNWLYFLAGLSGLLSAIAIAADSEEDVSVRNNLAVYGEFLSNLNPGDVTSVQKGLQELDVLFNDRPVEEMDAAFLAFRRFYYEVEMEQNEVERFEGDEVDDIFLKALDQNGFRLSSSEGMSYVDEHPKFLHRKFGERVSEPVSTFLRLRVNELKEGIFDDAVLTISFENLADRVRTWERYMAEHPDTSLFDEARYFYQVYLLTLLEGSSNTPIYDYRREQKTGAMTVYRNVQDIYRDFAEDRLSMKSTKIVKEYLALLEKSNFQQSEEADAFLHDLREAWQLPERPGSW